MANTKFVCPNDCAKIGIKNWFNAVSKWNDGLQCASCDSKLRWLGVWPSPKSMPENLAVPYEVVHVIRLGCESPGMAGFQLSWYKPVVLVCESPRNSGSELFHRSVEMLVSIAPGAAIHAGLLALHQQ